MRATSTRMLFTAAFTGALAALVLVPGFGWAFGTDGNPCGLISKSKVKDVLGFEHVLLEPKVGAVPQFGGVVNSECGVAAWNGKVPKGSRQAVQKQADGTAAGMFIDTYVEAPGPDASGWEMGGYDQTIIGYEDADRALLGPSSAFSPPLLGAEQAVGYEGVTKYKGVKGRVPIRVALGLWFRSDMHEIIHIALDGAKSAPVTKQAKKLAKTAVPSFL